ncbi:hypothetical protein SKAU_G00385920 [Synaphobranchus kaupii]|uniref:Uncharacterized protein n=1 Tax=Synaphobranchus kaupii TaxID=118154 RepID=A0A9Q1EEL0_SYNKA|nr:hypothetical protein SKAU_G00385920 [Synaphobranchus kaupii]
MGKEAVEFMGLDNYLHGLKRLVRSGKNALSQRMLLTKVNIVLENQKQIVQMVASLNLQGACEQHVQDGQHLEPCTSEEEFEDKLQDKQCF